MGRDNKTLVCIHCFTYNQKEYIRQCLNGFCMQQTDFPFVAVVVDDASTDGEQEVINRYLDEHFDTEGISEHPDLYVCKNGNADYEAMGKRNIQLAGHAAPWRCNAEEGVYTFVQHKTNRNCYVMSLNLKKNLYAIKSVKLVLIAPWDESKYIALCEGDDYWTDRYKLQKQVDFLEEHEDVGLCYTDYDICDEKGVVKYQSCFESKMFKPILSFEEMLLSAGYIAPMTWMYRRNTWNIVKDSMINVKTDGTYVMAMEFFLNSKVSYMPCTTATYRMNNGSVSHPISVLGAFNYKKGVYDTQSFYASKYLQIPFLMVMLKMLEMMELIPMAIKADRKDYIEGCRAYADENHIDISAFFECERLRSEVCSIRNSKAYRLGKFLLKPWTLLRQFFNKQ